MALWRFYRQVPVGRPRWRFAVAAVCTLALVAAGCGDDDSGGDTTSGKANAASGEPIKVMTVVQVANAVPPVPPPKYAAEATVKWLNANGGIGGRPIDLTLCDTQGTANGAALCAQQAVREKVVAVVGGFLLDYSAIVKVLEQAKIPLFGTPGLNSVEYNTATVFEMGGQIAYQAGMGYVASALAGCKSLSEIQPDVPGVNVPMKLVTNGWKAGGGQGEVNFVNYPPGTSDFASVAAKAGTADCSVIFLPQAQLQSYYRALQSVGSKQKLITFQGSISPADAKDATFGEGSYMSGIFQDYRTSPDWANFRTALKEAGSPEDVDYGSFSGQLTWAAFMGFRDIAKDIKDLDSASFLEAASKATDVSTDGALPPIDFTSTFDGLEGFPRSFVNTAVLFQWKNGTAKRVGPEFVDMTDIMAGKPTELAK